MTIDWASFTPWSALAGGALIGLAAALLILTVGRVAGISGIVGGLLQPSSGANWLSGDKDWRLAFLSGLVAAPLIWRLATDLPSAVINASLPGLVAAGLIIGISTRYGAGCTSGHGVCGLARLSPRSLVATLSFMTSGFVTVYLIRHVLGQ